MLSPARRTDLALLLLRLAFGGLMAVNHGWGKTKKVLDGDWRFADPLGLGVELSLSLAAGAELICAALVAAGLFTRLASLPLLFTMGVAAFVVHGPDPFRKKEMALLYLVAYAAIFLLGPGRLSLQRYVQRRLPSSPGWLRFLLG